MKLFNIILLVCLISGLIHPAGASDYIAWDTLYEDSWIDFFDGNNPNMYPVNAMDNNDINDAYPIAFVQAANGNKARGMNALKFIHGGLMEGHLVSRDKAGSFEITNTGDSNIFSDILLLIAVNTKSLENDFAMTINLKGQEPYILDVNDFVYYGNQYGRPSGFYSITDPNIEPISYAFDTAMISVYGVSGVTGLNPLGDTIAIEYFFDYVPAPVVFSVYGYVGTDPVPTIYHTNRAFIDTNNKSKQVSTFAVTVAGDLNGDLTVDFTDFAIMSENWLVGVR
ncbi:MAG: hypothetical protein RQ760_07450 [Sedimentisphaerales bacterium]|nr:hypothetical protein [Sedimentisphaerales bacterium]